MNLYIQRDQQSLGAFFFIHLAYHACIFDLARITLAGYNFPLTAALAGAPVQFRTQHQEMCRHHADCVSQILRTGLDFSRGGDSGSDASAGAALDDHFTATAAFESTKIQVIHVTTLARTDQALYDRVVANIHTNLQVLAKTHPYADMPNVYVRITP